MSINKVEVTIRSSVLLLLTYILGISTGVCLIILGNSMFADLVMKSMLPPELKPAIQEENSVLKHPRLLSGAQNEEFTYDNYDKTNKFDKLRHVF